MSLAIGPVPTPNPPPGVSYTPQKTGGVIYDQPDNELIGPVLPPNWGDYNLPGGGPGVPSDLPKTTPTGVLPSPTPQPQQQSINFNDVYNAMYPGWDRTAAEQDWIAKGRPAPGGSSGSGGGVDPNEAIRNQLSSSWDSYFRSLDDQYNALPGKEQDMQGIARNSYDQSVRDIGFEQENNQALLDKQYRKNEENQVRSLQDIADNIRNLYRSGNIYLGSRGAGDSSAANQYSYAVTKLGSKQRGDVLNQTRSIQIDIGRI